MQALVSTLLGEPLMNLRCATALLGAGGAALAGFVAPAALQTIKAGLDTAGRAVLCWLIATCKHKLKDSGQALETTLCSYVVSTHPAAGLQSSQASSKSG